MIAAWLADGSPAFGPGIGAGRASGAVRGDSVLSGRSRMGRPASSNVLAGLVDPLHREIACPGGTQGGPNCLTHAPPALSDAE